YDVAEYLAMAADYLHKSIEKDVEEPRTDVDGTVKDEVYEEDFREYLGGNDSEGPLERLDVKMARDRMGIIPPMLKKKRNNLKLKVSNQI
ncbi:hypothetical protein U1Q18_001136, partial [Sarracenia purpurea var. burkii]